MQVTKWTTAIVALTSMAGAAGAGTVWFDYTDSQGFVASGTLTVGSPVGGVYTALSGSINITAFPAMSSMTGSYPLIPNPYAPSYWTSPAGAFNTDNLLYIPPVGGPGGYLDVYGLLFGTATEEFNIWGNGPNSPYSGWKWASGGGFVYGRDDGTFTQTNDFPSDTFTLIPLPTPIALASAGMVGVAGLSRRRFAHSK